MDITVYQWWLSIVINGSIELHVQLGVAFTVVATLLALRYRKRLRKK